MPLGPGFARVGSSELAGGVVVVVVGGLVVVVVTTGFVVVVTTGFVVVVVTGGFVVVVVGAGSRLAAQSLGSGGGGDVSTGSQATPTTTSANAQISTPAPGRDTATPIRPPARMIGRHTDFLEPRGPDPTRPHQRNSVR